MKTGTHTQVPVPMTTVYQGPSIPMNQVQVLMTSKA